MSCLMKKISQNKLLKLHLKLFQSKQLKMISSLKLKNQTVSKKKMAAMLKCRNFKIR